MTGALVQTVEPKVRLSSPQGAPFPDTLSVVSLEIERVFGGGGSKATVEIVLDDFLRQEQKDFLQTGIRPVDNADESFLLPADLALDESKLEEDKSYLDELGDDYFIREHRRQELDITMEIGIEVTDPGDRRFTLLSRIFTGTLIKVEETNERVVKLHALDRRFQLNRNSVFLDADGQTVPELVRNILTGDPPSRDFEEPYSVSGLGLTEGEDFIIDIENEPVTIESGTWGVDSHTTVFEFLQDMAHVQKCTLHIDRYDKLHFISNVPESANRWSPSEISPIVEWTSANEENQINTIAETKYDETGLGTYLATTQDALEAVEQGTYVSKKVKLNNVINRTALENAVSDELITDSLMRDSGTIRVTGDPRCRPYDQFKLDSSNIDGFAPISTGTYMTKTVRHIIDAREGYVTEIELGRDPEELFEDFTSKYGSDTKIDTQGGEDIQEYIDQFFHGEDVDDFNQVNL